MPNTSCKLRNPEDFSLETQVVSDLEHFTFSREARGTLSWRPLNDYILLNIFCWKRDVTLRKCFDLSNLDMVSDLLKYGVFFEILPASKHFHMCTNVAEY